MINSIILEGRITRQPESKELSNEKKTHVCNFSLAHQKTKDEAVFFNVVSYNAIAEVAGKLKQGDRITVQGRLNQTNWVTQEGEKRQNIEIIADLIHFSQGKKESES